MSELSNSVYQISGKIQKLKRDIKSLELRGRNSIGVIRSKLDLLNLDSNEDITALDIESAKVELRELEMTVDFMKEEKEELSGLEKELKKIKSQLED